MYLKYNSFYFLKHSLFLNYLGWFKPKNYISQKDNFRILETNDYFKKIKGYRGFLLKKFRKFLLKKKLSLKFF
jgi:hypothetical protein